MFGDVYMADIVLFVCQFIFRLYAQERIDEIINKVKDMGFWDDTLVVITSDNGPLPGGNALGQTLPLRGTKS